MMLAPEIPTWCTQKVMQPAQ